MGTRYSSEFIQNLKKTYSSKISSSEFQALASDTESYSTLVSPSDIWRKFYLPFEFSLCRKSIRLQLLLLRHNWTPDTHDAFLWTCPSFFLIRAQQLTAYRSVVAFLFCFVFRDWNSDTFRCSIPSTVPTNPTTPSCLIEHFLSPISFLSGHGSHNTTNILNVERVTTAATHAP